MRPVPVGEADPVILCQFEPTARACIGHYLGARHSLRIELVVPGRGERIGPVNSLSITADLDHLRTACIGFAVWVRRTAYNAADADRSGKFGLSRIAHIVLTHLAGTPARGVEKL